MSTQTDTKEAIAKAIADLGLTIEHGAARGLIRDGWECVFWDVVLLRNGRKVWAGPWHAGLAHVPIPKLGTVLAWKMSRGGPFVERIVESGKILRFHDRQGVVDAMAFLANFQKVSPKLPDLLHSLLLDGAAHFDSETFEDWCSNFGYETDSRKAETMWRECDATGRALVSGLGRQAVDQLRELFADY